MSLLPIRRWPDPVLARRAEPVADPRAVAGLAADMLETMYDAPGRGLAAPQVGRALRLFVMDTGWREGTPAPRVCVNPEILAASEDLVTGTEACLSIPGIAAEIARPAWLEMRWSDAEGYVHSARLEGFDAVCAAHEHDHLEGRVIFDRLDADTRARLEEAYGA